MRVAGVDPSPGLLSTRLGSDANIVVVCTVLLPHSYAVALPCTRYSGAGRGGWWVGGESVLGSLGGACLSG